MFVLQFYNNTRTCTRNIYIYEDVCSVYTWNFTLSDFDCKIYETLNGVLLQLNVMLIWYKRDLSYLSI